MKTILRPVGVGADIEVESVSMWSDETLKRAHQEVLSKTARTQKERQRMCAILQEIKRRGRARK